MIKYIPIPAYPSFSQNVFYLYYTVTKKLLSYTVTMRLLSLFCTSFCIFSNFSRVTDFIGISLGLQRT